MNDGPVWVLVAEAPLRGNQPSVSRGVVRQCASAHCGGLEETLRFLRSSVHTTSVFHRNFQFNNRFVLGLG